MGKQRVGYKNVSIVVAAQNGSMSEDSMQLVALCSRNNYGRLDELVRVPADSLFACRRGDACREAMHVVSNAYPVLIVS
jgi:hypothetical protein